MRNDICLAQGSIRDMHYYLNTANMRTHCDAEIALSAGLKRWHERLGHVHREAIRNTYQHRMVEDLKIGSNNVYEK